MPNQQQPVDTLFDALESVDRVQPAEAREPIQKLLRAAIDQCYRTRSATDDPTWLCYRGEHCADVRKRTVALDDGTFQRQFIPAHAVSAGLLCRTDTTAVRAAIQQLPADVVELSTLLRKGSGADTPVSGTRELPTPVRLSVAALADEILDETERWAVVLAESCGMWLEPGGRRGARLQRAVGWLAGLYERLLRLPATAQARLDPTEHTLSGRDVVRYASERGIDGALRLLALHERTTLLAGRIRRAERLQAPCPRCHRLALEHDEGSSHVDCRRCGDRMPLQVYENHCAGVLARAYETAPRGSIAVERAERPARIAAGPPIQWVDSTVHDRVDAGSNMMLRYLDRYNARPAA